MLELVLCSMFTILPDYLYRRYKQGKRIGHEITLYSVWFELRCGITACVMLTVLLITLIFYHHPSSTNVTAYFRTIPILPETNGRVFASQTTTRAGFREPRRTSSSPRETPPRWGSICRRCWAIGRWLRCRTRMWRAGSTGAHGYWY